MNITFPILFTKQYKEEATKWLQAIGRGENISVLFVPKTDRFIRIGQLMNDKGLLRSVLGQKNRYIFQLINFDAHDVEDRDDLYHQFEEQLNFSKLTSSPLSFDQWVSYLKKNSITLVFLITEAENYLKPESKGVLSLLTHVLDKYSPIIHIMSFFETDITHPSLVSHLPSSDRLYENIFLYPLYPEEHTRAFIQLLANQWDLSIKRKTEDAIVAACGGHFWLVKEAVREIATTGHWSSEHDSMVFRVRQVYNLMLASEKRVIEKITFKRKDFSLEEQHSVSYLRTMNVIGANHRCLIGVFHTFLMNSQDAVSDFDIRDGRILLHQIPIDKFFSRKAHRVMKLLLEKRGVVISRDDIAQQIWPTNTQNYYSDWAIDQLIARVRKRLLELSLPPRIIQVVRGKGYRFKV